MFYLEAVNKNYGQIPSRPSVFMAGGITGCPDWQREMRDSLVNSDIILYNPRRADFPMGDPDAAKEQIAWEHEHLHDATAVSFWFPEETMCPIVLFELGAWSHWREWGRIDGGPSEYLHKPIFVGAHPNYQRREDVLIQLSIHRPEVEVVDSVFALCAQIDKWARSK